jgi:hypothetical protein
MEEPLVHVRTWLNEHSYGRWIGRRTPTERPLGLLHVIFFFCGGWAKELVCRSERRTLNKLQ